MKRIVVWTIYFGIVLVMLLTLVEGSSFDAFLGIFCLAIVGQFFLLPFAEKLN